uniref:Polyprotein protein n=1 Tax=Solanum tuberosum TaxID=4113 RepID=M1DEE6_SOLTU
MLRCLSQTQPLLLRPVNLQVSLTHPLLFHLGLLLLPPSTAAATSRPPLTQAMLFKMGHLAHSIDVRAFRVEAAVPGKNETDIAAALAPIHAELGEHRELIDAHDLALDVLMVRVEAYNMVTHPEVQSTNLPAISVIPPATTIVDVVVADEDAESEALKTDKEELGACDAAIYDHLEDL